MNIRPKNFKEKLLLALAPTLGAGILRAMEATWRIQEAGHKEHSPLARPKGSKIYAIWHESVLTASFYRGQAMHALASQSFDGELISRALVRLGWKTPARGSSSRGGSTGLNELNGFLALGEHVLLTVDGPRGPRRRAKDGAVQLARLSGCAVVPVAFACRPAPRLKSWDRMILPPPLARGVFWFGEELHFKRGERTPLEDLNRLQDGVDQTTTLAESFFNKSAG